MPTFSANSTTRPITISGRDFSEAQTKIKRFAMSAIPLTEHVGKVGKNNDELGLHRRLKTLQEQLEEALREKKYGEADRLNKQINSIKKTLHGGGSNG